MHNIKNTLFNNHKGLTLVEVLASIVILSIIMISILMILAQTAKTNKTSEEIIDATYYAQAEMEYIYNMSLENKLFTADVKYEQKPDDGDWQVYHKEIEEESDYFIKVKIKPSDKDIEMIRVVVEIYDKTDSTKSKAQMENLLKWGAGS